MNVYHKHSTVFALENNLKNAKFSVLLPLKQPLVATLSKMSPLIPRRYVAEQVMDILN